MDHEAHKTRSKYRCKIFDEQSACSLILHVCKGSIVLQNSIWGVEQKFLEPLMRFAGGDVRDHIG